VTVVTGRALPLRHYLRMRLQATDDSGKDRRAMSDAAKGVVVMLSLFLAACGGERRADSTGAGAASTDTVSDTAAAPATPASQAPAPDSAAPKDTSQAAAPPAAQGQPATKPSPKPAPAAKPPTPQQPAPQAPAASGTTSGAGESAPLRDAYHQAPRDTVSQVVYDGWKQYNLNCARCHGEDVLGTTIAPHLIVSLKPDGPINTKELFVQTVCAGRPAKGMPAWCSLGLEMDKINAIYEYVKGRSAGEIGPGRPAVKQEG